jgi:hypothetical protein
VNRCAYWKNPVVRKANPKQHLENAQEEALEACALLGYWTEVAGSICAKSSG